MENQPYQRIVQDKQNAGQQRYGANSGNLNNNMYPSPMNQGAPGGQPMQPMTNMSFVGGNMAPQRAPHQMYMQPQMHNQVQQMQAMRMSRSNMPNAMYQTRNQQYPANPRTMQMMPSHSMPSHAPPPPRRKRRVMMMTMTKNDNATPGADLATPPEPAQPTTRRSGRRRNTKSTVDYSLLQESSESESEEEPEEVDPFEVPDPLVIEKILQHRQLTRERTSEELAKEAERQRLAADRARKAGRKPRTGPRIEDNYEYLVKWRKVSYMHLNWVTVEKIRKEGQGGRSKLLKYWKNMKKGEYVNEEGAWLIPEDDYVAFPVENIEVERIIGKREFPAEKDEGNEADDEAEGTEAKTTTKFLVKWRGLPYTDATFETPEDIKEDELIAAYEQHIIKPPYVEPPPKDDFEKEKESPVFKNDNKLRKYQLEGLNWLVFNFLNGRSCILADEMGLGKTVQSVAFLDYVHFQRKCMGPFLVVVPLSTVGNWQRELEGWSNMNVVVYQGNKDNRELIRKCEFFYPDTEDIRFQVLLTTYEMLLAKDWEDLGKIDWKVAIIDEAQRLKSRKSKLLQNMRKFKVQHRILLTGTPIQNNTSELWTLMNFVDPDTFVSHNDFYEKFGDLSDHKQVEKLHTLLHPYLLRRLKEDVEKSIPPKEETLIEVQLTRLQKEYYQNFFKKNRDALYRGCTSKNAPKLINIFMQLRKVCNHPYLIKGCEEKHTKGLNNEEYLKHLVSASGKLTLLDKLLPRLYEGGHKVLIFSQMVRILDLLETYLSAKEWQFERLDGSVRGNDRQAAIDRFCKPQFKRFVFLLCTRAGGVGINLAAADTVIIYDSDWNPQNDIQAQARCHRIGQKNEVKVYRLITAKTYEREMFERASRKLGLDQAVLSNIGVTNDPSKQLDEKEIDTLLRYGAYDLFREDNEADDDAMLDIDAILERSSKVVWNQNNSEANSTFSKAKFQIDIDADDYWDKILPQGKTPQDFRKMLESGEVFKSKNAKKEFMKDVKSYVDTLVSRYDSQEGDVRVAKEISEFKNILLSCQLDMNNWTKGELKKMGDWAVEVELPTKRGRGGDDDEYVESSVAMSRRERLAKRAKKKHKQDVYKAMADSGQKSWDKDECTRFHEAFLSFGRSMWSKISKKAKLENKTLEEVYCFAKVWLAKCAKYSDSENDKDVFRVVSDSLTMPTDEQKAQEKREHPKLKTELTNPKVSDPEYKKIIRRKVKAWTRRLRGLGYLCDEIEDLELPMRDFDVVLLQDSKPLTRWWTTRHDVGLLVGVYKYGYGEYDKIKSDPDLPFLEYSKVMEQAAQMPVYNHNAYGYNNHYAMQQRMMQQHTMPMQYSVGTHMNQQQHVVRTPQGLMYQSAPQYNQQMMPQQSQMAHNMRTRAQVPQAMHQQGQSGQSGQPARQVYRPPAARMNFNSFNWELYGVRTNAFECPETEEELEEDEDPPELFLYFKMRRGQYIDTHHDPTLGRGWPAKKTLDRQVKFLIDQIGRVRRTLKKQRRSSFGTRMRIKGQSGVWTRRQETEMRAGILMYGDQNWELLRQRPGLEYKTVKQLQEYFSNLLFMCRRNVAANPRQLSGQDAVTEPIGKLVGPNRPTKEPSLTMARRIINRTKLLRRMKEVLTSAQNNFRMAQAFDMPYWWTAGKHDLLLLKGLSEMGYGWNEKWEAYINKQSCPFYHNDDGKTEHRKMKQEYMEDFLCDRLPLQQRVKYLIDLVLDPQAAAYYSSLEQRAMITRSAARGSKRNADAEADGPPKKRQRVPMAQRPTRDIPRDGDGRPIMPITAKGTTIHSLGAVVYDRPNYHSKNYIWPVGFKSTRKQTSLLDDSIQVTYTSEIIEQGDAPAFRVTPEDCPQEGVCVGTASRAWTEMLRKIRKREQVSVSGPEMFGFADATVKMLIQELPNADMCTNYEFQNFEGQSPSQINAEPPTAQPVDAMDISDIPLATSTTFATDNAGEANPSNV